MAQGDALTELVERQAITEVLHAYCYLVDVQDYDAMVKEVFAVDGAENHGEYEVAGREAIRDWFVQSTANLASTMHAVSNLIIKREGNRATMRSTIVSWAWTRESEAAGGLRPADYATCGYYLDQLRKDPEGWRIVHRTVSSNGQSVVAVGAVPLSQKHLHSLAGKVDQQ